MFLLEPLHADKRWTGNVAAGRLPLTSLCFPTVRSTWPWSTVACERAEGSGGLEAEAEVSWIASESAP